MQGLRALGRRVVHGEVVAGPAVAVGLLVAGLSFAVEGTLEADGLTLGILATIATVATFLFGVLLAFTIERTRLRLSTVHDFIRRADANLLAIHQLVEVFPEHREAIRARIDAQLIAQIDYRLAEFSSSTPTFLDLSRSVIALEPSTPQQEIAYYHLLQQTNDMSMSRALMEAAIGQSLSRLEWTTLLLLLGVMLSIIVELPKGSIVAAVVAGVLAATLVALMTLLRKLDRLLWHERASIWEPQSRLFRNLGLLPYVPRHVIDAGRFTPTGRVRVVDYTSAHPDLSGKVVTEVDFG
ncbi:MAG: hypothetical protein ACKO72_01260 [Actinomycetes bacterium]